MSPLLRSSSAIFVKAIMGNREKKLELCTINSKVIHNPSSTPPHPHPRISEDGGG